MRLYQTVPDCEESEAEHLSPVHWCCVAYEPVAGRWVPWCVAHETAQDHKAPEDASCPEGWEAEDCRWHPQGAFIPKEADDE